MKLTLTPNRVLVRRDGSSIGLLTRDEFKSVKLPLCPQCYVHPVQIMYDRVERYENPEREYLITRWLPCSSCKRP
jgi:hypothetical protein